MTISFAQIGDRRVPGVLVEIDSSRAIRGVAIKPHRVLIIAQKTSSGTLPLLTPTRISRLQDAIAAGGAGSMLHAMAERFFANNSETEAFFVAVAEPSGASATGTLVFTGPATIAGTVYLYIAGRKLQVAVAAAATATQVATAVAAAVNANTTLPVTASSSTGTVTLTSKHVGVCGNDIDVRLNYSQGEALPVGIGCTVTAMGGATAGTGNVDLSAVWDVLGEEQYEEIALPGVTDSTNLASVEGEMLSRWGALRAVEGIAFTASRATFSNLVTLGDARNSQFLCIIPATDEPTPTWEKVAAFVGQVAAAAQKDPARPFRTLPLNGILAPAIASRFTASERETLLRNGIATCDVDPGGVVRIERAITTYKVSSLGTDDPTFLDINTVLTLGFLRYSMRTLFAARYPRHKLADDDARVGRGQAVLTPSIAKAELIALFRQWEEQGLVEGLAQFRNDIVVERNAADRSRLDVQVSPDLINGLNLLAIQVQFIL